MHEATEKGYSVVVQSFVVDFQLRSTHPSFRLSLQPPHPWLLLYLLFHFSDSPLLRPSLTHPPIPLHLTRFDSLRHVPAYDRFVQERFHRCLDLYLCPRARRVRVRSP